MHKFTWRVGGERSRLCEIFDLVIALVVVGIPHFSLRATQSFGEGGFHAL